MGFSFDPNFGPDTGEDERRRFLEALGFLVPERWEVFIEGGGPPLSPLLSSFEGPSPG
jgi:hypothetical protein